MPGISDDDLRKIREYAERIIPPDLKFAPADEKWTLYWSDRNSRWHVFDLITPGAIGKILREVERDQTNIFWG
jgi:hypothetical protein